MGTACSVKKDELRSVPVQASSPVKHVHEIERNSVTVKENVRKAVKINNDTCESSKPSKETVGDPAKSGVGMNGSDLTSGSKILQIKEVKVLPPISRPIAKTFPDIAYRPGRVWGGSLHSFCETVNRDVSSDEDLVPGTRRKSRRLSSLTHHKPRRHSKSGELISWEKQVTLLGESPPENESAWSDRGKAIPDLVCTKQFFSFGLWH